LQKKKENIERQQQQQHFHTSMNEFKKIRNKWKTTTGRKTTTGKPQQLPV